MRPATPRNTLPHNTPRKMKARRECDEALPAGISGLHPGLPRLRSVGTPTHGPSQIKAPASATLRQPQSPSSRSRNASGTATLCWASKSKATITERLSLHRRSLAHSRCNSTMLLPPTFSQTRSSRAAHRRSAPATRRGGRCGSGNDAQPPLQHLGPQHAVVVLHLAHVEIHLLRHVVHVPEDIDVRQPLLVWEW